jgi:hypothetical protein
MVPEAAATELLRTSWRAAAADLAAGFSEPLTEPIHSREMRVAYWSGWAMPQILAGGIPARVTASHGPGIQPCRHLGNRVLDA